MSNEVEDLEFFKELDKFLASSGDGDGELPDAFAGKSLEKAIIDRMPSEITKAKIKRLKVDMSFENYIFCVGNFSNHIDRVDLSILRAIIKDQITRLTPISQGEKEHLGYKKLLDARENNEDFDLELAERIIGDHEKYPYKSSSYITEFFHDLGFSFKHDGTTRRYWVAEQLQTLEIKEIYRIIQEGLFRKKYFEKSAKQGNIDSKEFRNDAIKDFKEWIEENSSPEEYVDMGFLLNANVELLYNKLPETLEEGVNKLMTQARDYFQQSGGDNKQNALEKIWDAFERMKKYHEKEKDTKKSAKKIISKVSTELDKEVFDEEFDKLVKIGNKYMIRHHGIDQIEIKDTDTANYLFIRIYNLIDFCLHKIADN